jgi:hypothetical protein
MLTGILIGGTTVLSALGVARGLRRIRAYVTGIVSAAAYR